MPDTRHSPGVMAWCLVLLLCLTGLSEATAQQGWSVEQFTAENGLPQNLSLIHISEPTRPY